VVSEEEVFYAIRRTDGVPIFNEYGFAIVDGPDDWAQAEDDADYSLVPIEYELVRMRVERIGVRSFPKYLLEDEGEDEEN
jgi:hypothetical protein